MKKTLILFTLTSFISCGQHTEHTVSTVKKIQQLPTKTITNTPQSFSNVAKEIAIQTKVNDLPLQLIGKFTIPTYINAQGYIRPKWGVWWNFWGKPFTDNHINPWEVGLMGNVTIVPEFYSGYGKRGLDYIWQIDLERGKPWNNDIDPFVGKRFQEFISTIPYQHRFFEGSLSGGEKLSSKGMEGAYDFGRSTSLDATMGWGDNINGKSHRGLVSVDIEDGTADYGDKLHRAVLIGMAESTTGDVSSDYGGPINTLGYIHDRENGEKMTLYYPDAEGNYTNSKAKFSEDWLASTTPISIPSKGVINKRPIDYPNIIPSNEISFYSHEFTQQGKTYDLGNGNMVVINKYGNNRNTEHFLARAGTLLEWQSWYCRYKLNNRRNKMLTKVIADKGPIGLNPYVKLANGNVVEDAILAHRGAMAGRRYAFDIVSINYMNNVDLHEWDKNSFVDNKAHDTYIGFFAAIKMLMTNRGGDSYLEMVPQYWETEQSYDHKNWVKHKAVEWADSPKVLPCRTKVGPKKLEAMCWRSEGIEPTEVWLRANVDGVYQEIHITPDAWETTNPIYKNKPLASIPTADKEYFYTMLKF
ncbi:hypothetical protein VB264_21680 [Arcicella aquatica]|uniref:Uncharacterized protein n=1 Tax=Arcicella aquatica TaxID=217141 RepID=A0ABU5QTK4_9BACT|nr:hypothetical protein [Arcicella aquatica]MEA5260426.1 hypothetical protein [Arcicella aquatica]